jgi:signal transduction histidine kinase
MRLNNTPFLGYRIDKIGCIFAKLFNLLKTFRFMKKITVIFFLSVLTMAIYAQIGASSLVAEAMGNETLLYWCLGTVCIVAFLLAYGFFYYRHNLHIQQIKQSKRKKQLIAMQALLEGETSERSRIARDLHDGLGGLLSVIKLNLNDRGIPNSQASENTDTSRHDDTMKLIDQAVGELRRIAHHMMPESLLRYGLKTSIEDFCRTISCAHFQYYGSGERLNRQLEVMLYRCVFELVNNAVKYATATDIHVQLIIDNGLASLTVHDNGVGFDPLKDTIGSGLKIIRNIVSAFNGKIFIKSSPEDGAEISIEIENTNNTVV